MFRPEPEDLEGFGPGKVILVGEHAVVYGHAAVAGPLNHGVSARGELARKCELVLPKKLSAPARKTVLSAFNRAAALCGRPKIRVRLESDLPVSMGLGSSAALSVACARLLLKASGRGGKAAEVTRVADEMERVFHGSPSGIDHSVSAAGKLIHYRRRPGSAAGVSRILACPRPLRLLIALSGTRSPTHTTVALLRSRMKLFTGRYERLMAELGKLAGEATKAIEAGDLDGLGDVMNVSHGVLAAMQVSSGPIDAMVHRLRRAGALGAKLTGAGGEGGAVIALFPEPEPVMARLQRDGIFCFTSRIAGPYAL